MRNKGGLDPDGRSLVDPSAGIGTISPQGGQFGSKLKNQMNRNGLCLQGRLHHAGHIET